MRVTIAIHSLMIPIVFINEPRSPPSYIFGYIPNAKVVGHIAVFERDASFKAEKMSNKRPAFDIRKIYT